MESGRICKESFLNIRFVVAGGGFLSYGNKQTNKQENLKYDFDIGSSKTRPDPIYKIMLT